MTVIFIISSIYTIAISAETPLKGSYDLFEWMGAMGNGVISMGKLIIITMMAEGMLGYPKTYL